MLRRPNGYVGTNHETLGSDILSVLDAVTLPEATLGINAAAALQDIRADRWYPIATLIDLLDSIYARAGALGLRRVGRAAFKRTHEATVMKTAKCARDIIYGIDGMYRGVNRGTAIGGWKVIHFSPGRAEIEKTTPHLCELEEGILDAALKAVGAPSTIVQRTCLRNGADRCVFEITSSVADRYWSGDAKAT